MQHTPVDRVPVMCQLSVGHYLLNTHVTPVDLWFTSEGFAEALVTLQRRYRFDGILINLLGTDPAVAQERAPHRDVGRRKPDRALLQRRHGSMSRR